MGRGSVVVNRENPGSNNLAVKLWQFRSPHFATVHNCINEYVAIDKGGYVNE